METTTIYKLKPFSGKIFCDIAGPSQRFDPYLVIRYGSTSFYTTVSKNTGKFPYWNDSFTFRKSGEEKIWVECWDYNVEFVAEKEAFLGKGVVEQAKCLPDKKTLLWISIERPKPGQKDETEKTCELLIELEVCSIKKPEEKEVIEETMENEVMILEEINGNIVNEKNDGLKENEVNYQQNIERKVYTSNPIMKVQPPAPAIHTSQRTYSNNVKIIPTKVMSHQPPHHQNFGGIINMRPQNHNMMIYHQQPQFQQYSL